MWRYRLTAPKPEKEGRFTAMARPTAATYPTEQTTPHLAAAPLAATRYLPHACARATPYRTVITADRPTTYGVSGFTTEGARRVGLGHLRPLLPHSAAHPLRRSRLLRASLAL